MPKGKINKIPVDKAIFMAIIRECGSSINKLGKLSEVEENACTERTIRRALNNGEMTPRFLNQIARFLDVDPRLLSGELHKRANSYSDELLKKLYIAQLTAKNYPYYRKRKSDLNKQPIEDQLEQILSLFEISISQYEDMDFEAQYHLQRDIFEALVPVIRTHFKEDAYGRKDMPNLEKIISDLEDFREDHYLHIFAEEVLRKRYMDNPPPGKTKIDICRMTPDALIALDMYSGDKG